MDVNFTLGLLGNLSSNASEGYGFFRKEEEFVIIYCVAFALVFVVGLIGNMFVVLSVLTKPSMRNITNYFITSLAIADLLIIIFCLPATLNNIILTEWHMGDFMCKVSTWLNAATSACSVYTLVAVTADRYLAICHTMRYNVCEKGKAFFVIIPIWILSGLMFSPYLYYYKQIAYYESGHKYTLCRPFMDENHAKYFYVLVNVIMAFVVPLVGIVVCYIYIFVAIFRRKSFAVDKNAAEREARMRMKVTHMMLTVIILFAVCWTPLYSVYTVMLFGKLDIYTSNVIQEYLTPTSQWMSLANSCINPILYAYFSAKFRAAFQDLLVGPCRQRYQKVRRFARAATVIRRPKFSTTTQAAVSVRTTSTVVSDTNSPFMTDRNNADRDKSDRTGRSARKRLQVAPDRENSDNADRLFAGSLHQKNAELVVHGQNIKPNRVNSRSGSEKRPTTLATDKAVMSSTSRGCITKKKRNSADSLRDEELVPLTSSMINNGSVPVDRASSCPIQFKAVHAITRV